MKGIIKIFKVIIYTILTILVIMNITIFVKSVFFPKEVPSILGYKPFIVLSNSMYDEFSTGDLIITKEVDYSELEKGDIISFMNPEEFVTTHRIQEVVQEKDGICFVTKGDNNNSEDSDLVCADNYEGKYIGKISRLGGVILFIQEPFGFIMMMLVIIMICFIIYFSDNSDENKKNKNKKIEDEEDE